MGYSPELKTSFRDRKSSKIFEEKFVTPRVNRTSKSPEYCKAEKPFGHPYISQNPEGKQSPDQGPVIRLDFSVKDRRKSFENLAVNDGIGKHTSYISGCSPCVQNGENIQVKAFSVGVLNRGRLENRSSNGNSISPVLNQKSSSSETILSFPVTGSTVLLRTPLNKTLATQRKVPSSNGRQLIQCCEERRPLGVGLRKERAVQHQGSESSVTRTLDRDEKCSQKDFSRDINSSETMLEGVRIKVTSQASVSEKEAMLSGWSNTKLPEVLSHNHEHFPSRRESITSFGDSPGNYQGFQHSGPLSFDFKSTGANESRFSDCFSPDENYLIDSYSEVPHSCPLPIPVATRPATYGSPYPNEAPVILSEGRYLEDCQTIGRPLTSSSKTLDQAIAEGPTRKGRPPSPMRRFTRGLGRMTRSLSISQSQPVEPEKIAVSTGLDSLSGNKENGSNRGRSSPLRRFIDPLLKVKGAHMSETVKPSKPIPNYTSFYPVTKGEMPQGKKHEPSSVRALLQLTMKNGIPFFKLVAERNRDVLAAAVKKLPTYGKNGSILTYAIFSVHESKKNGKWINQAPKEKSCGFGYDIVGQLNITSSDAYNDRYMSRESVLYDVDKKTPDFMPNHELAAVIVKKPRDDRGEAELQSSRSTVVVLPDGIHGLPNSGEPTLLINRWRSGGICDCGGWDVGCKLQVLTNKDEVEKILTPSSPCSTASCLDLCSQGDKQGNKIFSLTPQENGLYSLEYDAPISLLQAFSVCVAVVTDQELAHIFLDNDLRGESYVPCPPSSPIGKV